jgi:hypothetical protein
MAEVVGPGAFSLFTATTGLPNVLSQYAYPGEGALYGVLAAASLSSQNPPSLGGVRPRSGQPVYAVNTIRFDPGHRGSTGAHVNVDRALLFVDERGNAHRVTFKDHAAHYLTLSQDTALPAVLQMIGVPNQRSGALSELSAAAGWPDFSTGPSK